MKLRERLIEATIAHVEGKISYHKANVEVYLTNPAGIGEHPDIMEALLSEMKEIAENISKGVPYIDAVARLK